MKSPIVVLALFSLIWIALPVCAQRPEPTEKNIAYDSDHGSQVLDFYRADSEEAVPAVIYFHGGGWRAGSKDRIPGFLANMLDQGIVSVVSVEYRFTDVAVHPAQVNDCIHAIQFVRSKAVEWNIDPDRIAVTGGSAGGHLSLWVALHDDMSNPESDDPVERESSRVTCAVGFAGPTDWSLLGKIEHRHPAYRQLLGYEPGTPAGEMDEKKKADVSPITYATADDPPVLIVHGDADDIVPVEHAEALDEKLDDSGADAELYIVEGGKHNVAGAGGEELQRHVVEFLREHLLEKPGMKKVAIVVGPSKHPPGTHEVAAGGRLMSWCLNHLENVSGIESKVFHRWTEDPFLADASSVVFIGDQFPAERLSESDAAMADLSGMTADGCGIVCVHYATGLGVDDVTEEGEHPLLGWTGGYFATRCNHHQSKAAIFEATITPIAPVDHPIRRGWDTFQVKDEPYTRNWFGEGGLAEGAFALATAEYPPEDPKTEIVAWAIERDDGGRGAGITMPHFYRNWEREELRRFILNTIVWSAGGEVPADGVKTTLPDLLTFEPKALEPLPRKKPANK